MSIQLHYYFLHMQHAQHYIPSLKYYFSFSVVCVTSDSSSFKKHSRTIAKLGLLTEVCTKNVWLALNLCSKWQERLLSNTNTLATLHLYHTCKHLIVNVIWMFHCITINVEWRSYLYSHHSFETIYFNTLCGQPHAWILREHKKHEIVNLNCL